VLQKATVEAGGGLVCCPKQIRRNHQKSFPATGATEVRGGNYA